VTYINGWPHSGMTANVASSATSIPVDDITGWTNARGTLFDGAHTETFTCTATTPNTSGAISGPGTLTVAALHFAHNLPNGGDSPMDTLLVTSLPSIVQKAAIFVASAYALTRGATAISVPTIAGAPRMTSGATQGVGPHDEFLKEAEILLEQFQRIV